MNPSPGAPTSGPARIQIRAPKRRVGDVGNRRSNRTVRAEHWLMTKSKSQSTPASADPPVRISEFGLLSSFDICYSAILPGLSLGLDQRIPVLEWQAAHVFPFRLDDSGLDGFRVDIVGAQIDNAECAAGIVRVGQFDPDAVGQDQSAQVG